MIISVKDDLILREDYKRFKKLPKKHDICCSMYFCDSNGYKIVGISDNLFMHDTEGCEYIDDITIELYSGDIHIYAYKDNEFLTLEEAYNLGVVSRDTLEFISYFSRDKDFIYEVA